MQRLRDRDEQTNTSASTYNAGRCALHDASADYTGTGAGAGACSGAGAHLEVGEFGELY